MGSVVAGVVPDEVTGHLQNEAFQEFRGETRRCQSNFRVLSKHGFVGVSSDSHESYGIISNDFMNLLELLVNLSDFMNSLKVSRISQNHYIHNLTVTHIHIYLYLYSCNKPIHRIIITCGLFSSH